MTLWLRRRLLFVLSLIESLLLFIGARQPGQLGRQSYADHIEGLHYLEASYFLFSPKGRARESTGLAKGSEERREGENKKCVHESGERQRNERKREEVTKRACFCGLHRGAGTNYT